MDYRFLEIERDAITKSAFRLQDNDVIASYYSRLSQEYDDILYHNRSEAVTNCFKVWDIDNYSTQKIKDVLHVNCCKDKFCGNCQNVVALRRYGKYRPILDNLLKDYDIYHMTFTVPNCSREELKMTIEKIFKKFAYIPRYFKGVAKIKHLDFGFLDYYGAVRSLEITTREASGGGFEFHPHLHTLFVVRKGLEKDSLFNKHNINSFSFSRGKKGKVYFSDFEILIQKIWYLVYNGQKVTLPAIEELKEGYSCMIKDVNGNYKEVFKYAVKGILNDKAVFTYDVFETLYFSLYRKKVIQGYGALNRYDFELVTDEEIETEYEKIKEALNKVETPYRIYPTLDQVFQDFREREDIRYISKNRIRNWIIKRDYEDNSDD